MISIFHTAKIQKKEAKTRKKGKKTKKSQKGLIVPLRWKRYIIFPKKLLVWGFLYIFATEIQTEMNEIWTLEKYLCYSC